MLVAHQRTYSHTAVCMIDPQTWQHTVSHRAGVKVADCTCCVLPMPEMRWSPAPHTFTVTLSSVLSADHWLVITHTHTHKVWSICAWQKSVLLSNTHLIQIPPPTFNHNDISELWSATRISPVTWTNLRQIKDKSARETRQLILQKANKYTAWHSVLLGPHSTTYSYTDICINQPTHMITNYMCARQCCGTGRLHMAGLQHKFWKRPASQQLWQ